MKKYGAPSVKKAFAILNSISSSKEGLGVSDMAKKLKMAKSTVHGMTSALEELGAVMRDPRTKNTNWALPCLKSAVQPIPRSI